MARGDALPGTDIDLRFILVDGASRPFDSRSRNGILVERTYADARAERAKLETHPMNIYAHLDGRVLHDPHGVLASLKKQAQECFDGYEISPEQRDEIAWLMGCSRDKIRVALAAGDLLKAAFATGTTSWPLMEGLWAANNRPLPPNSSVRPHLRDLTVGPPDIEEKYRQLFLSETPHRVQIALDLLDWIIGRLQTP
ncbi:MAG: hypothetical protein J2P17_10565 [Mycobacterium sp.]|nr:hypothetical protein [Mycobacterium sp.]